MKLVANELYFSKKQNITCYVKTTKGLGVSIGWNEYQVVHLECCIGYAGSGEGSMTLLTSLVVGLSFLIASFEGLLIGSFNIQTFGTTKYAKEDVMGYIDKILSRYDIVLVQEIRDSSGVIIPGMLDRLNSNGGEWAVKYSESLGRSTYKEQYAYYYRKDRITVESSYQYDDGEDDGTDAFSREPFGILINSDITGDLKKFGILGVHIAPEEAVEELNALVDVFTAARENWGVDDVMIMGDFNADCTYVSDEKKEQLDLRTDNTYLWLIGDDVDTTVSNTNCAYDRMVLIGEELKAAIKTGSAKEFRYDDVYSLDAELAGEISDHYPVEVELLEGNSATQSAGLISPRLILSITLWYILKAVCA
ncbi:deoxyribonuclease-1-like [Watersipora subatra]|uniref:deoxyribonuclease-1-like n=1 Tax=Watersipora subatra TaxID=2589382 RepID=UPI00355B7FC6